MLAVGIGPSKWFMSIFSIENSFRLKTVYKYWASARSHKQCFTQNKSNTHRERNTLTQKKVIIYQVFFSFFFFFRFEIKQNEITKQRGKKRNALIFTYKVFFGVESVQLVKKWMKKSCQADWTIWIQMYKFIYEKKKKNNILNRTSYPIRLCDESDIVVGVVDLALLCLLGICALFCGFVMYILNGGRSKSA